MITAKVQTPFTAAFETMERVNILMLKEIIGRRGAKGTPF